MRQKIKQKLDYVSVREMRRIDARAVRNGITIELMMENAGKSLVLHVKNKFKNISGKKVVCIAGKGHNGGGVIASVRHLAYYGAKISLLLLYHTNAMSKSSKFHLSLVRKNAKVKIMQYNQKSRGYFLSKIKNSDIILDGIFGTGFSGSVDEPILSIISEINKSNAYVVSNDVPSGIEADTGKVGKICVKADFTIVLHRPKRWISITRLAKSKYSIESIGISPTF